MAFAKNNSTDLIRKHSVRVRANSLSKSGFRSVYKKSHLMLITLMSQHDLRFSSVLPQSKSDPLWRNVNSDHIHMAFQNPAAVTRV